MGDVIRPLRFAPADSDAAAADHAAAAVPVAERLRARRDGRLQPAAIADTPYGSAALAGATIVPFDDDRGRRGAARRDARADATCTGTRSTPPATATARRARRSSPRRCARWTRWRASTTPLLVTADHGQIDVDETDELDRALARAAAPPHARRPRARRATCSCTSTIPDLVIAELSAAARRPGAVCLAVDALRRTPARACASASPTSACCPPRAGWSALTAVPEPGAAASRATTAASRPRRSRPGSASGMI